MANDWTQGKIADYVDLLTGLPFKSDQFRQSPGVKLARGMNVKRGEFEWSVDETKYWSEITPDLKPYELRPGDILIGMDGSRVGENWACVSEYDLPCLLVQRVARLRAKSGLCQGYLKYLIGNPAFTAYVKAIHTGTSIPHVSGNQIGDYSIAVPPPDVQRRIADVLGKLDDKIELNRRMNRTLEKMAAAIFKSWFIDFDPVHAKAEGRGPSLPAEIADLFPDTFENSELGAIPAGWKPGALGDVADSPRRGVKPSQVPPTTPYIGLEHMPRRNIALEAWGRAEGVASGKSQFNEGEILFGKLRPYLHKVGIAPVDGVCSTDIVVVTPKTAHWHGYVISLVSSKAFVDYTDSHSAGTKMPRTNWKDMSQYPLALPPEPLAKAFQGHVAALHKRIGVNVRQNRRLAALRDTLLPKLLSGEIEIPALDGKIEQVSLAPPVAMPAPYRAAQRNPHKAPDPFREAILIAALTRALATQQYPLGRMRYTKFSYLVHRKIGHNVTNMYLKKAAGPYNPKTKYGGPEKIALGNAYITAVGASAFTAGDNARQIDQYLGRYNFKDALDWAIRTFRYRKTDDLELLTTVDYATLELRSRTQAIDVPNIRTLLASSPDWAPKLNRDLFSNANIQRALDELVKLFPDACETEK